MSQAPKVFISYSHDNQAHKNWVKELATYLRGNGVDVILDQWDLTLGSDLAKFMEHGLSSSERVLIISTDHYINKANSGNGGVGYEKMITTAEMLTDQNTNKFIPIIRNVSNKNKLPIFLGTRLYIDFSDKHDTTEQREMLLKEIHKAQDQKPPIGNNPFIKVSNQEQQKSKSDVKIDSTTFFSDRFSSAFPGVRGIKWFDDLKSIKVRLCKLLENPLHINNSSPIWWWRGIYNLHIHSFKHLEDNIFLMDRYELKITKIAAVNQRDYYQKFVYVETEAIEPTGIYDHQDENIAYWLDNRGYHTEEYGLYKNKDIVTREEYDDNAAFINDNLVELGSDVELRVRYITPYNFIISAQGSSINNKTFDRELEKMLNLMLHNKSSIEDLTNKVLELPKRDR